MLLLSGEGGGCLEHIKEVASDGWVKQWSGSVLSWQQLANKWGYVTPAIGLAWLGERPTQ